MLRLLQRLGRALFVAGLLGLAVGLALPWETAAGRSGFALARVFSRITDGWGFTAGFSLWPLLPVALSSSLAAAFLGRDRVAFFAAASAAALVLPVSAALLVSLDGLGPGPWVCSCSSLAWATGAAIVAFAPSAAAFAASPAPSAPTR